MTTVTISEKKAQEIVSAVLKLAKEKNMQLPRLEAFVKEGAKAGVLIEAYDEFSEFVNRGKNTIQLPLEYSVKFKNFVFAQLPNKRQIAMFEHYGKIKLGNTLPDFFQ